MKSQTPAQCSITMLTPLDLSVSHTTFHTTTSLVNLRSECDCSHLISHHTSHLISTSHRPATRPIDSASPLSAPSIAHCPRSLPSTAHCPRSLPSSLTALEPVDLASASFSAALDAAQTPANQRELKSFRTHPRRGCALPIGRPPLSPIVSISGAKERARRSGGLLSHGEREQRARRSPAALDPHATAGGATP